MNGKYEKFETENDSQGRYRWRFRAMNGDILFVSSEGYNSAADRDSCLVASMLTTLHTLVVNVGLEKPVNRLSVATRGITAANVLTTPSNYLSGLRIPPGRK